MPSLNILIDMIRKGQSSARPNLLAINTFKRRDREKEKQQSTGKLSTLDTELAMWTGDIASEAKNGRLSLVGEDGRCKQIDSSDGVREGWLKIEAVRPEVSE